MFEVETEDEGPCITFVHPWTARECVATEGDWHHERSAALRQAERKRRCELRQLISRAEVLNDLIIQEYEVGDIKRGKLRHPRARSLELKRYMDREGSESHWGDRELPTNAEIMSAEMSEEGGCATDA